MLGRSGLYNVKSGCPRSIGWPVVDVQIANVPFDLHVHVGLLGFVAANDAGSAYRLIDDLPRDRRELHTNQLLPARIDRHVRSWRRRRSASRSRTASRREGFGSSGCTQWEDLPFSKLAPMLLDRRSSSSRTSVSYFVVLRSASSAASLVIRSARQRGPECHRESDAPQSPGDSSDPIGANHPSPGQAGRDTHPRIPS